MNKMELVAAVAVAVDLPRSKAAEAVEAVFDAIRSALRNDEDVRLVGFGTFATARRAPARGRNPRTGVEITIPPVLRYALSRGRD